MPVSKGTFHFHSTYSHDGRSTLDEIARTLQDRGFKFCVMTEHFEDFDSSKFDRYLHETRRTSEKCGFTLLPGVEINLSGLDTIIFPARSYEEIFLLATEGKEPEEPLFKVLAHASKYPFEAITRHLNAYKIDGLEIWNQQADGSYRPPFPLLNFLKGGAQVDRYRYFFGCDLHDVNLKVANVLAVSTTEGQADDAILNALRHGDFVSENLPTGIQYRNGCTPSAFESWVADIHSKSYRRGEVLHVVRRCLKAAYKMLPRATQHSLNDVKNYVRNKV